MRDHRAIIVTLGLGLATVLGTATPAIAQEHAQGHGHLAAPQASVAAAPVRAQAQSFTFDVAGVNQSGITGTARLTPVAGDKVEVAVSLDGAGAVSRPIHIHAGACADLNPDPEIPLATVTNGTSTTEVEASLQTLLSTPHAIFVHKSPQEIPIFVACADLGLADRVAAVPSTGEGDADIGVVAGLIGLGGALVAAGAALRRRAHGARASSPECW